MTEKIPVGILISGRGSNMLALLEACREKDYPCEPVVVISNRPDAAGIKIAQEANVPTYVVDHKEFPSREKFEEQLNNKLKNAGAHILCNAGFMRILTEQFTDQWHNRHLNIHPSLLPYFPGINVHERVLKSGVKITGCTVHFVRSEVDAGPIIGRVKVEVRADDNVATLSERVLRREHKLYPYALRMVADGYVPANDEHEHNASTEFKNLLRMRNLRNRTSSKIQRPFLYLESSYCKVSAS